MKNSDDVRQSVLDAASFLFGKLGYEKTTMGDIAGLSRKAKTSIYYYFDSKMAILSAVLSGEFRTLRNRLAVVVEKWPDEVPEQLMEYMRERMELFCGLDVYKNCILSQFNNTGGEIGGILKKVRGDFDRWEYDYFFRICTSARSAGVFGDEIKPDAFAETLIMLLKGVELQFFTTEKIEETKSTYNAMLELLVNSIYK